MLHPTKNALKMSHNVLKQKFLQKNCTLCFETENGPQNPNNKLFLKWQSRFLLRALRIAPQSPASDYVSRKINCAEEFLRTLNFHSVLKLRPAKISEMAPETRSRLKCQCNPSYLDSATNVYRNKLFFFIFQNRNFICGAEILSFDNFQIITTKECGPNLR